MIGRGSRKLPNKDMFTVIDLGNNAARFGLWSEPVNWQHIFKSPEFYLENLRDDTEIELYFKYSMPLDLRAKFSKTAEVTFDVDEEHKLHRTKSAFKSSFRQIVRATFIDVWIIQKRCKRNHYLENWTKISNAELNAILNV
jgi:hypothetical protein